VNYVVFRLAGMHLVEISWFRTGWIEEAENSETVRRFKVPRPDATLSHGFFLLCSLFLADFIMILLQALIRLKKQFD
jgi:hypothetical protein